jgi:hypothetical protein
MLAELITGKIKFLARLFSDPFRKKHSLLVHAA